MRKYTSGVPLLKYIGNIRSVHESKNGRLGFATHLRILIKNRKMIKKEFKGFNLRENTNNEKIKEFNGKRIILMVVALRTESTQDLKYARSLNAHVGLYGHEWE